MIANGFPLDTPLTRLNRLLRLAFSPGFGKAFRPVFDAGAKVRTTLTLQPNANAGIDTYILSTAADSNTATAAYIRTRTGYISLLLFSGLTLPASYTLVSAQLILTLNTLQGATATQNVYRMLAANAAWTESGATWNYAVASTVRWAGDASGDGGADAGCSVSGTDYSSTLMSTQSVPINSAVGTAFTFDLLAAQFNLMAANNYGFVMINSSAASVYWASSDHATEAYRPKLVVVYDS